MTTASVTSKGQITIPADVRKALYVGAGDRVDFMEIAPGRYELVAATQPVTKLKNMFGIPDKAVTIEQMNADITKAAGSESWSDWIPTSSPDTPCKTTKRKLHGVAESMSLGRCALFWCDGTPGEILRRVPLVPHDVPVWHQGPAPQPDQSILSLPMSLNWATITDTMGTASTLKQDISKARDIVTSRLGNRARSFVYGSCANDQATRTSDIDIGIIPIQPIAPAELSELRDDLRQSNILFPVDLVDLSRADPEFRHKVLEDAIEWTD